MADVSSKKVRRLRQAPQTMRERAERSGTPVNLSRFKRARIAVGSFFRKLRSRYVWKTFRISRRFFGRILFPSFLRNSFRELRYVTWPNRQQTFQLTSAVIIFSVVFGIVVGIFDLGLDKLFKQVILR
jgi:preprotein translocase SecE subunit